MTIANKNNLLLVVGIMIIIVCVIIAVVYMIQKIIENRYLRYTQIVEETSRRLIGLKKINQYYSFYQIPVMLTISEKTLQTKAQYDRYVAIGYESDLNEYIKLNRSFILDLYQKIKENSEKYEEYQKEISYLPNTLSADEIKKLNVPYEHYIDIEKSLIRENKLNPINDPKYVDFIISVYYTSPQGRNSYDETLSFTIEELIERIHILENEYTARKNEVDFKAVERRKMNQSLRYSVMQRDGFKCVLCGRSAKDGVKLEVDHIKPISKGGTTTYGNLRTLCEDCNRGKRDRYDENGNW